MKNHQKSRTRFERNLTLTKISFFFILLLITSYSYCQKKISYVVSKETHFEISNNADLKNVTSQDLILMKPEKEKYIITREIRGKKITEVKEYINYNKTESWIPDIKKMVIDNNGTKIYNSNGDLIFERKHLNEIKIALKQKALNKEGLNEYYEIPDLNKLKNDPKLGGTKIKENSKSNITIKRGVKREVDDSLIELGDTEEIELDDLNLTIKTKIKNSKNHEIESEDIYLKKLPKEKYKSLKTFERLKKEHPKYSDIYKVNYILYENYLIDDKEVFKNKKARKSIFEYQIEELDETKFKVYPNPAGDQITLHFSSKLKLKELEITNSSGLKFPIKIIKQSEDQINLDVSNLLPGIYIISLHHFGGQISQKILKN